MNFLAGILVAVALLVIAGIVYQAIGTARDHRRFPPPGRLIDVGGHRLHIHVMGEGSPTVVLESGVASSSPSWRLVQPEVAKFAQVVTYDRAGLGWSDPGPLPRSPERLMAEYRTLLERAGIAPPVVLVGHSFGGLLAHCFAGAYADEVAGLVLVDPPNPAEWLPDAPPIKQAMLRHGAKLSRRGTWCARLGITRLCLALLSAGMTRAPRSFAKFVSGRGVTVADRIVAEVRKLPMELRPVLRALWSQPKCFDAMAHYLESLPATSARAAAVRSLGDLPLVVITSGNATAERVREQDHIARLSSQGTHIVANESNHWVQLDEPGLLVAAIREVVDKVRRT